MRFTQIENKTSVRQIEGEPPVRETVTQPQPTQQQLAVEYRSKLNSILTAKRTSSNAKIDLIKTLNAEFKKK
jgi:hypothetical protein